LLIRQGITILREFKSLTLRHFIDEIKTKALLDCRAFFVKYDDRQVRFGVFAF